MRKLVLAVLVASCGSDSGGSIGIDDLDNAIIARYCSTYVQCGVMPDEATCQAYFAKLLTANQDVVDAVKAGKVVYHGDKAAQCIDAIGGSCDRTALLGNRTSSAACDAVYDGTVPADGTCALNQECISQVCTKGTCGTNTCCMGTCTGGTKPVRGAVGATCTGDSDCSLSFCDTTSKQCTAYLADGATCNSSTQCQSAVCSQTCQPLVAEGAACTTSSQCKDLADNCNAQHVCSKGGAVGAACTSSNDCAAIDRCDATMHCAARPIRGDACMNTFDCFDDSYCDPTGTCAAPVANGGTCKANSDCSSQYCDTSSMTCAVQAACI
ncbi:MAG TPA: hypothetical protein VFQ65_22710 [Kofleriaceae bacterium]|nr:hypothetical protein [Kofleriaceae bacterium]